MNQGKTVLVAERSPKVREGLLDLLGRYGYRVLTAESPSDAISTLQKEKVDLLMIDVGMPGGEEATIVEEVRLKPSLENIPIIVLANIEEVGDVANWISIGCNDFLLKPVNPRLLFQRVQALIESNPRAYNRVPCGTLGQCTTGMEYATGELMEIGEGGASFVLDRPLATEDIIKLTFTLPSHPVELTVGAEIIYVREATDGFVHGLRFIILDKETRERIKRYVQDVLLQDA